MVLPPPATAPSGLLSAPLSSDSPTIAVSGLSASPGPPTVAASFSDANSSVSPTPHLALFYGISSMLIPPARFFPSDPLLLLHSGGSSVISCLPLLLSPLSPLSSPDPLPPCQASFPVRPCFSFLFSYSHLRRPVRYCVRAHLPSRLLPRPQPPISLIRTNMSAIGRVGVAKWGVGETEEWASEKEAATIGGPGEAGRLLTAIGGESEESGADSEPEGAVAGGGNTTDATSTAADEVGARGHHGWRTGARVLSSDSPL